MSKITYPNKVALNENSNVPDINKVKAGDMNEIKQVVNENADTLNNLVVNTLSGNESNKAPSVSAINDALIDNYSTSEVKTNKRWIDGKPIYRKVLNNFLMPELSGSGATATASANHGIANIDTPISVKGWIPYDGNNLQFPILSSNGKITTIHYFNATSIAFRTSDYWAGRYITVIVEYTKTTDTATNVLQANLLLNSNEDNESI